MTQRIDIEGTVNFRDVGGYPAGSGRTTRHGQLYRSDALSAVTAVGAADLAALRIDVVVDLRSDLELRQDTSRSVLPGATVVHIPITGGSRTSILDDGHVSLELLYRAVLADSGSELAAAVEAIAGSARSPVLVHCSAGKDRTGLAVALALEVAGVDREAVIADYTQSALNLDGEWMGRTISTLISRGVPISPRLFEVLGGSPDHAMSNVLTWLDEQYGSAAGYLTAHGLMEGSVDLLREKLVM